MRQDYCDITLILDESGSMCSLQSDTIGGVNRFLSEQNNQPGKCVVSLITFNHEHRHIYLGQHISHAPSLTKESYRPSGSTALLDAVGFAIDEAGSRFKNMAEQDRPSKVLFVIVTDGEENCSKLRTKAQVKDAIERQQNIYKWEFVFMGANVDAFSEAGGLGISKDSTLQYTNSPIHVARMYHSLSANTVNFRAGGQSATMNFTQEQRDEQEVDTTA